VHGHTHKAARHSVEVDGRPCERWVLPDWYGPGGYLEVRGDKPRLVRF
jgi:UDP-2,3-diacylglucosamine hydrolase